MQLHRVVLLVILLVLLGLMTVFQPIQTWRLGYRITTLNQVRDHLVEENKRLELVNTKLGTPEALLQRASAMELGLNFPKRWCVLRARKGRPVELPTRAVAVSPRQ